MQIVLSNLNTRLVVLLIFGIHKRLNPAAVDTIPEKQKMKLI